MGNNRKKEQVNGKTTLSTFSSQLRNDLDISSENVTVLELDEVLKILKCG